MAPASKRSSCFQMRAQTTFPSACLVHPSWLCINGEKASALVRLQQQPLLRLTLQSQTIDGVTYPRGHTADYSRPPFTDVRGWRGGGVTGGRAEFPAGGSWAALQVAIQGKDCDTSRSHECFYTGLFNPWATVGLKYFLTESDPAKKKKTLTPSSFRDRWLGWGSRWPVTVCRDSCYSLIAPTERALPADTPGQALIIESETEVSISWPAGENRESDLLRRRVARLCSEWRRRLGTSRRLRVCPRWKTWFSLRNER